MQRRTILAGAVGGTALAGFALSHFSSSVVAAVGGGKEEICVVVPFPAGGGGDTLARCLTEAMTRISGNNFWIANKPGAGGNIGVAAAAKTAKPETTLSYVTNGIMCVNRHLYPERSFDARTAMQPVGRISKIAMMAVINPAALAGVSDFESLMAYAKKNPGALACANSGIGTTSHIAAECFAKKAGIKLNHIPHAGGAAAIREVLAGRIPFMIEVMPNVMAHIAAGSLKPLAVTTPERSPFAKDVPTMSEIGKAYGLKGFSLFAWDGIAAPLGMSKKRVKAISKIIEKALADDAVRKRLTRLGAVAAPATPEEFAKFIDEEAPKWEDIVKSFKAKA